MSSPVTSSLQLGWTGRDLVAWWWDGRSAIGRTAEGGRIYSELLNHWGWMPPGAASRRIQVTLPMGVAVVPAIALPPASWPAPRVTRTLAPSASMVWCTGLARVAARVVGGGHALPSLERGVNRAWTARWRAVASEPTEAALTVLAAAAPPVVSAVAELDGPGPPTDPAEFTRAFHQWLVDQLARSGLRQLRWSPPLKGLRGSEVTAMRAISGALVRPDPFLDQLRPEAERQVPAIADALELLAARAGGTPVVSARLRLGLPAVDDDALEADEPPWTLTWELVDRTDTSRWCTATDVWEGTPLAADLAGSAGAIHHLEAELSRRTSLAASVPALATALGPWRADRHPSRLELDLEGAASVLEQVGHLSELGVQVLVPAQLLPATTKVRASASTGGPAGPGRLGAKALVDWSMVVDGTPVNEAALERALAAGAGLLNIGDRWVQLDPTAARKALKELTRHRQQHTELDAGGLLSLAAELAAHETELSIDDEATAERDRSWLAALLAGLPDTSLDDGVVPGGFNATLRPYQLRGLGWLQFLSRLGLGGCLADDMGLGKTPTTLAHLAGRPGPHLVVCPLSVVRNWQSESARFAPALRVLVHHGTDRLRGEQLRAAALRADLVVSTYGLVTRDLDALGEIEWTTLVLDEAQAVKNPHTKSARAVRRLKAGQKLALTGTPIENRLGELWAILDVVNPGLLGSEHVFRERWANPIERDADQETAARLRALVAPLVLRRTKADKTLVPDLPDKVEQIAWATLTREQATLYQAVVEQLLKSAEQAGGMQRRGLVLAALTRLKQICNHPAHALGDGSRLPGRSGKLARFDELVADLLDAGEQALVFTQYRQMGELLQRHLVESRGLDVPFLHGGVAKLRRDRMVERFQDGDGGPLLLVSLKAGGTGLNLTAASRVVHYDRWWNPAVEDQATDRAWRIGQERSVFVHKLVCQGTLEERIAQVIDDKRALAGMVVGTGEAWLSELSTDDLRDLVVLGSDALG